MNGVSIQIPVTAVFVSRLSWYNDPNKEGATMTIKRIIPLRIAENKRPTYDPEVIEQFLKETKKYSPERDPIIRRLRKLLRTGR